MDEHEQTSASAPPQYSPDGRWWWTGEQWVPAPAPPASGTPTGRIVGALLIAAVIIAAVVALADGLSASADREQQYHDQWCASYGDCD